MWKIIATRKERVSGSMRTVADVACDCGAIEVRRLDHVMSGRTKSCKSCSAKKTAKKNPPPISTGKFVGKLSKTKYGLYRNGATKRGIEFNVSMEYMWRLFVNQGGICALSGESIQLNNGSCSASLDRKDSKIGYIKGNLQWVHKDANNAKMGLSDDRFIELCKHVTKFNT